MGTETQAKEAVSSGTVPPLDPGEAPSANGRREPVGARVEDRPGARAIAFEQALADYAARRSPRDVVRRRLLLLADTVALAAAFAVALLLGGGELAPSEMAPLALALPAWLGLHKLMGLYDRDHAVINSSTIDEIPKLWQSIAIAVGLVFLLVPLTGLDLGRGETILFLATALVAVPGMRVAARSITNRACPQERLLIVGSGPVTEMIATKVGQHPEFGARVTGCLDLSDEEGEGEHGPSRDSGKVPHLGSIDDFELVCREHGIDRVVVAFSALSHQHLLEVINTGKALGLKISILPRLYEALGGRLEVDDVEGLALLGVRGVPLTRTTLALKRSMDLVGATLCLLLLAPLMLAIAAAVKASSPGRILFRQTRIGRGNRPFTMIKFRTMVEDADRRKDGLRHLNEADGVMFKISDDPRITPVGSLLRRLSLDELPQLINVLRGEMSLVGPRPLVPEEDTHVVGWHRARLNLMPGLTGPWQVLGRTRIPFEEMVRIDYLYVAEWSLWNDVKLLVRTVPVVLRARGA